jgi:plasmid stability protein
MSKMVQIRNVPDELHRALKVRAAQAGMTLSDYLLAEVRRFLERPSRQEFLERLRSRAPVQPGVSVVEILREGRDSR